MKKLIYALHGCCAFDIKNDPLVKAFLGFAAAQSIEEGVDFYSDICRILVGSDMSLGGYVHDMLINDNSDFIRNCASSPTELQIKAVRCDISALKLLCGCSAADLKRILSQRGYVEAVLNLPDYEQGSFNYTAEYFLDCAANGGSQSCSLET